MLERSPASLVQEIILLDDASDAAWLGQHLLDYMKANFPPKVRYVRSEKRLGLIRARLFGAENAKGKEKQKISCFFALFTVGFLCLLLLLLLLLHYFRVSFIHILLFFLVFPVVFLRVSVAFSLVICTLNNNKQTTTKQLQS